MTANATPLQGKLLELWAQWKVVRPDSDLKSAAVGNFIDWVVGKIAAIKGYDNLANWYELRAVHARAKANAKRPTNG